VGIDIETVLVPGGSFQLLRAHVPAAAAHVLVLHGFPDHPPTFAPLIERLAAAGYDVAAPWMRGYAPSTPSGPYDLERLGHDLLEIADEISPERPVYVVGHDWGALATYAASAFAPHRIRAAVTLAVPHPLAIARTLLLRPGQLRRSWYMLFFQLGALADRVAARADFALIDRLWRDWSPGYALEGAEREALHACLAASWPAPLAYYRALMRPPLAAWHRTRPGAPLRRPIEVATLQLQGENDGCIAPAAMRGQERFFAGPFRAQIVMGAGHFLQVEAPDQVADLALDWFAEHA
jgi:pimeloyl-ACP methyl ester carboxylesterase